MVTVIDTRTNRTTAIPLPNGSNSLRGLCLAPDGKHAYVAHLLSAFELVPIEVEAGWMNNNVVSVIDVARWKVIRTIGLDDPKLGMGNPWAVACTSDGRSVCVSHAGVRELSVVTTAALSGPLERVMTVSAVESIPDGPRRDRGLRRIALSGDGPRTDRRGVESLRRRVLQ